jgi:hypothetical protein
VLVERSSNWSLPGPLPGDAAPPAPPRAPQPRQRTKDRLGAEGVAQLVADYQAGRSTNWLQRTYKLSQGAVLRLLDVNGVPRRQRGYRPSRLLKPSSCTPEAGRLHGSAITSARTTL